MKELQKLKKFIERRLRHSERRATDLKSSQGSNPGLTQTYHGGKEIGNWEGQTHAYTNILEEMEDLGLIPPKPLYKHDCEHCTFFRTGEDDYRKISDIYVCGDCVTFRYSDEPSDNRSICFNKEEKDAQWFIERNPFAYNILQEYKESLIKRHNDEMLQRGELLTLLQQELDKAYSRQKPNPKKDSGYIKGLKKAIDTIEEL